MYLHAGKHTHRKHHITELNSLYSHIVLPLKSFHWQQRWWGQPRRRCTPTDKRCMPTFHTGACECQRWVYVVTSSMDDYVMLPALWMIMWCYQHYGWLCGVTSSEGSPRGEVGLHNRLLAEVTTASCVQYCSRTKLGYHEKCLRKVKVADAVRTILRTECRFV